jgi:hypothetical protein
MKQLLLLITAILFSTNFANSQPRNVNATAPPPVKVLPLEIFDDANSFYDKGLPEPQIIGENPTDKLAAELAKKISEYDEESLSILIGTLQKAGFYIIDENQKILYQPTVGKGMGLGLYDFEIVGMYKLSRTGYVTSVSKMAGAISRGLPDANLETLLLQDLRAAANSNNSMKRFWARLIIELGKQFPNPVDLMTATPDKSQLNVIQATIWERRLVGDLIAFASQQSSIFYQPRQLFYPQINRANYVNASFTSKLDPCDFSSVETTEVDAAATATTTAHGKVLEKISESSTKLEKFGKGLGGVNLALSWAKLVAAVTQMKGEIQVQQPLPLIRTKSNKTSGEKRLLTGKFEIKVNDLRKLNCVRMAINATTGMDFSMPSSGPLGNKPVSWELGGEVSFKGQNSSKTGEFEQVVYLLPKDGEPRDQHKQETGANGISEIYLEGAKQKEDLNGQKVVPLPKMATVRADIALKNMSDSKQEAVDVGSFGVGLAASGGPTPLGILSALPELGFRAKIPVVAVKVPIRDWTPCSEDWGGTINFKKVKKATVVRKSQRQSNGNGTGDGILEIDNREEAEIILNPRKPEEMQTKPPNPPTIVVNGRLYDIFKGLRQNDPCCGKTEGNFRTKFAEGSEETFYDVVKKEANVNYIGSARDYSIGFSFFTGEFKSKHREFYEVSETSCELELDGAKSEETERTRAMSYSLDSGRYGQRFVNSEGELLQGEKVVNLPDGTVVTWNWALARCKD